MPPAEALGGHRTRGALLYRRHTLLHQAAFHDDAMAVRSWRELSMVLFPWPTVLAATAERARPRAGRSRLSGPSAP
jgi:hypothetical protein